MNRLADTLSPYLRSHADNPVDWFPWGQEAFDEAQRRDVPLLISIGYSTCHWCHVMARESFADATTAGAMNDGFVSVKVDREEHPDVDGAYMAAASAFTRNLGWPLTIFATPQGRVFHAGTYWPPEARGQMPAFRDVLAAVREAWTVRREQAVASADAVAEALSQVGSARPQAIGAADLRAAAGTIAAREDRMFGGFGGAPKFPVATALRFLRTPFVRTRAPEAAAAAERAMIAMVASELRDDIEGGFFRYATQRDWSVPHYERMLVDNAQLLALALDLGDADTASGVAEFLLRVLRRASGAFGSAQDSESWIDGARSEGGYYALDAAGRAALEPPAVDGKVITGWNGLSIGALARAGFVLGEPVWVEAAADAARAVLADNRGAGGELVRASLDGVASTAVSTVQDAGLLADGLFDLAAATGDVLWAVEALAILDAALDSSDTDPVLRTQGIPIASDEGDGDLPSGTAALALAALSAWRFGAGERYRAAAERLVESVASQGLQHPFAYGALLTAAAGLIDPPRQLVVVTDDAHGALARAAAGVDADLIAVVTGPQAQAFADAGFELFEGRSERTGVAYDCLSFVCRLPISDPEALLVDR